MLPIDPALPEIIKSISIGNVVLQATPGSGKTTKVPAALLAAFAPGQIWVLEPRRVAARLAAEFVSQQLGETPGNTVGYQYRLENLTSDQTRIIYMTEGTCLAHMKSNPTLKGVSCIVLDEFHERHLQADLVLNATRALQKSKRPDLKILVMSATLDPKPLENFLEASASLKVETPVHPLEIEHVSSSDLASDFRKLLRTALKKALAGQGDILIFLPGKREIQRAMEDVADLRPEGVLFLAFHGDIPVAEQVQILSPIGERRRVIFSTNLAETSVTVPGVRIVIDSGLHKVSRSNSLTGLARLETKKTSLASVVQRSGRAARTAAGKAYRLFSKYDEEARLKYEIPEIHRLDLADFLLDAHFLSQGQLWEWFDAPKESALALAMQSLHDLGAINEENQLTSLGRAMAELSLPARLARVLLAAKGGESFEEVIELVVKLNDGERLSFDAMESVGLPGNHQMQRSKAVLKRWILANSYPGEKLSFTESFLRGYFDLVAKPRSFKDDSVELSLSGGGSVRAERQHHFWSKETEYVMVLDGMETSSHGRSQAQARSLLKISENDLMNSPLLETIQELLWNSEKDRFEKISQLKFLQLVLYKEKEAIGEQDFSLVAEKLTRKLFGQFEFKKFEPSLVADRLYHAAAIGDLKGDLARLITCKEVPSLQAWIEELLDENQWVLKGLHGVLSFEDLAHLSWMDQWLKSHASDTFHLKQELDRLAPTHFQLPNGRRAKINYELDKLPWIESRMQDFFGLKTTPSVLRGQLPLVLHLLAPNNRAVQITQDLKGFWKTHYPAIRKELMRKYPRHKWPEDPEAQYNETL